MSDTTRSGMAGSSGGQNERVTVRLSEELLADIESLVDDGTYENVSEVFREGVVAVVNEDIVKPDADR